MAEMHAEHLIVGAGILGLALGDHLLRRGARHVVILERARDPVRRALGTHGMVLRTGLSAYRELEDRGLVLLEEWKTYLEVDPRYRRCGSTAFPALLEVEGEERLGPRAAAERAPGLHLSEGEEAVFCASDGFLDAIELASALLWQIRRRGGYIIQDCVFLGAELDGSCYRFRASNREGRAERIYLAAGAANPELLAAMGVPSTLRRTVWQSFEFETDAGAPSILRLDDGTQILLHDDGTGRLLLLVPAAASEAAEPEPRVDWGVLEAVRTERRQRLPRMARVRVRRGRAERLLDLERRAPGIVSAHDGRLLAAGAFGPFLLPLALSVAERLAETGLAAPR